MAWWNIAETGRTFDTRLDEHKKEVETVTTRRFTWETRKCSTNVEHKSAITDHAETQLCDRLGGSEIGG